MVEDANGVGAFAGVPNNCLADDIVGIPLEISSGMTIDDGTKAEVGSVLTELFMLVGRDEVVEVVSGIGREAVEVVTDVEATGVALLAWLTS